MLLCSDDRERAVALRSEISSLLLLGGVYETMSITVAMRESRREKEPTLCARTAHIVLYAPSRPIHLVSVPSPFSPLPLPPPHSNNRFPVTTA